MSKLRTSSSQSTKNPQEDHADRGLADAWARTLERQGITAGVLDEVIKDIEGEATGLDHIPGEIEHLLSQHMTEDVAKWIKEAIQVDLPLELSVTWRDRYAHDYRWEYATVEEARKHMLTLCRVELNTQKHAPTDSGDSRYSDEKKMEALEKLLQPITGESLDDFMALAKARLDRENTHASSVRTGLRAASMLTERTDTGLIAASLQAQRGFSQEVAQQGAALVATANWFKEVWNNTQPQDAEVAALQAAHAYADAGAFFWDKAREIALDCDNQVSSLLLSAGVPVEQFKASRAYPDTTTRLVWACRGPEPKMAALSYSGDYVISQRPSNFTLSFRPTGEHHPLGSFGSLQEAQRTAQDHHDASTAETANKATSPVR